MNNEEIKEVEETENIEVLQDEFGNIINLDTNEELECMGKGDESNGNE